LNNKNDKNDKNDNSATIGGQLGGSFGVTYFFF